MQQSEFRLTVVMQKRVIANRWQSEIWEPVAVMVDSGASGNMRRIAESNDDERWLFPGLQLKLRREEAEGYYLNISTQQPRVFVMWQTEDARAMPRRVTASYNEACTWMDAGEQVDSVAMPPDVYDVISAFTREHYRPEPKKRIRPRSFASKEHLPRPRR